MRIIGGEFKGRVFHPGKSFKARPTTDFAKENLFNILENRINWETTDALDLFSGTGSITYELASRGCRSITAVEQNYRHFQFIREIKEELKLSNLLIIREDAFRFLARPKQTYDLIFADPPYTMRNFQSVAESVLNSNTLRPGGLFVLEHSKENNFSHLSQLFEMRHYGSVHFSFFKND